MRCGQNLSVLRDRSSESGRSSSSQQGFGKGFGTSPLKGFSPQFGKGTGRGPGKKGRVPEDFQMAQHGFDGNSFKGRGITPENFQMPQQDFSRMSMKGQGYETNMAFQSSRRMGSPDSSFDSGDRGAYFDKGRGPANYSRDHANLEDDIRNVDDGDDLDDYYEGDDSGGPVAYEGVPTTLMIRNIPPKYKQDALVEEWPNNGTYDYFYLPYSCSIKQNLTYAFINFTSQTAALDFQDRWDKQRLRFFQNRKPLTISCADVQGRDENIWQLQKKWKWRLQAKACQPLIYNSRGHRISLADSFRLVERMERMERSQVHGQMIEEQ
jgi:hypothetical protein